MIKTLYYFDLKIALRASFENRFACYVNKQTKAKCWLSEGQVIHFEKNTTFIHPPNYFKTKNIGENALDRNKWTRRHEKEGLLD